MKSNHSTAAVGTQISVVKFSEKEINPHILGNDCESHIYADLEANFKGETHHNFNNLNLTIKMKFKIKFKKQQQ